MKPNPPSSVRMFDDHADEFDTRYRRHEPYLQTYEELGRYLPQDQKLSVLDIACGPAHAVRTLMDKGFDLEVLGIDLSSNMLEAAGKNVPSGNFKLLDARNIDQLDGPFDLILCGFCIPYLPPIECIKLISDLSSLLTPGGCSYLSAIEGETYLKKENATPSGDPYFVHHYPVNTLESAFAESNLQVLNLERKPIVTHDGSVDNELFFYLKRGPHA